MQSLSRMLKLKSLRLCLIKHYSKQQQITQVRNHNLRLNLDGWIMHIFPFHPQVIKRPNNIYQIKKNSTVLAFTFVPRVDGLPQEQAWNSRKSMTFKFMDLSKLISIKQGCQSKQTIQQKKQYNGNQQTKYFILKEQPKSGIQLILQSYLKPLSQPQPKLEYEIFVKISFMDYRLIRKLIQNNLGDLSGWTFMLDMQKKKILESISKGENLQNDLDLLTSDQPAKKKIKEMITHIQFVYLIYSTIIISIYQLLRILPILIFIYINIINNENMLLIYENTQIKLRKFIEWIYFKNNLHNNYLYFHQQSYQRYQHFFKIISLKNMMHQIMQNYIGNKWQQEIIILRDIFNKIKLNLKEPVNRGQNSFKNKKIIY